jgi:hypothetical protein
MMRCDLKMKIFQEKFKLPYGAAIKVRLRALNNEGKFGRWSRENSDGVGVLTKP